MASTGVVSSDVQTRTVKIDTNLSGKEYYFVDFDASDDDVVNLANDQTLPPFVLVEGADGSSTPTTGTIVLKGVTKLKINETVTAGKFLVPTAAGLGEIGDAAGERYGAIALAGGVQNDIIPVLAIQGELEASDA